MRCQRCGQTADLERGIICFDLSQIGIPKPPADFDQNMVGIPGFKAAAYICRCGWFIAGRLDGEEFHPDRGLIPMRIALANTPHIPGERFQFKEPEP